MTGARLGLLFPGQGSQYVGMGKDLADAFPAARDTFAEADEILDFDLSRVMWSGPEDELVSTRVAQPAILTHSVAVFRLVARELDPVRAAAGHSLGEFSAHVAAGTLGFADALRAVRLRGELMHQAGSSRRGTMAAVLGLENETVRAVCDEATEGPDSVVVLANFNSPGQVVISGDIEAVDRAAELASEAGARKVVRLSVSGAFHSPLMEPARDGLSRGLPSVEFQPPRFPVFSNVTAEPVADPESARRLLLEQLVSPVSWDPSIRAMIEGGVDHFIELGPGKVLRGLNRRIARETETVSLGEAGDLESWARPSSQTDRRGGT